MSDDQLSALRELGGRLDVWLTTARENVAAVKSDETVDDDLCDEAVAAVRQAAMAWNLAAPVLGVPPVEVPDELDPSPHQEDDEEDEDGDDD